MYVLWTILLLGENSNKLLVFNFFFLVPINLSKRRAVNQADLRVVLLQSLQRFDVPWCRDAKDKGSVHEYVHYASHSFVTGQSHRPIIAY